jgi:hypothetical protein
MRRKSRGKAQRGFMGVWAAITIAFSEGQKAAWRVC